ncbi:hypothetical protein CF319_g8816 [Tilletia indica]|uniref:Uncharacterized protein n=1 Tax=Tilletia indica TaxID=43049 RepID=A0A177T6T0_9BASI|nr:hypothetical protein CF319_g8816 [Tilletia indica]KAE8235279.1 hypothetical protein A4X13_0g9551 [Tilletia indica]
MRFTPFFPLPLVFLAAACTAAPACKDFVIISARGTSERQGPSFVFVETIKQVLGTLPNGATIDTVYPADRSMNIKPGVDWINQYITTSLESCPMQKFALLGYSQGAMVVSAALQELMDRGGPINDSIKAVLLFGNPYHVPNREGNVDEHGGSSTTGAVGVVSGMNPTAASRFAVQGRVLDVCFTGDTVCNRAPSKDPMAHGKYGASKEVQEIGADFLLEHLRT